MKNKKEKYGEIEKLWIVVSFFFQKGNLPLTIAFRHGPLLDVLRFVESVPFYFRQKVFTRNVAVFAANYI